MDVTSIQQVLSNLYIYGWAGTVIFFILFVLLLKQNSGNSAALSKLEKEKSDLESQLSECREEVTELQSKVDSLVEDNEQKAEAISRLESQVSFLEKELKDKEAKVKELEFQVKNLKNENIQLGDNVKELQGKLSGEESKSRDLEAQLKQKENLLTQLQEEIARVEKELEQVKTDYKLAELYIHLSKLHDEYGSEFTQNILKGLATMNIAEIDLKTAQKIFEQAKASFQNVSSSQVEEEPEEVVEDEEN